MTAERPASTSGRGRRLAAWLGRRPTWYLVSQVVSIILIGFLVLAQSRAGDAANQDGQETSHLFWTLSAVSAAILVALINMAINALTQREVGHLDAEKRTASRKSIVLYNSTLDPLIQGIGEIAQAASPGDRLTHLAEVRTAVLSAATSVGSGDSLRALWYAHFPRGGRNFLSFKNRIGRQDNPRTKLFCDGTTNGDHLIALLRDPSPYYCPDVLENPPPGMVENDARKYRSFVVAPVTIANTSYGLLMVDSLEPNYFTEHDVSVLGLLARTLGAAMAYCDDEG